MKKRLKENSLLGAFHLVGTPKEQEQLNKLLEEVLNIKSGKQLVEEVLGCDFVHKPIKLSFIPEEKLDGWAGTADAKKGILLAKSSTNKDKDERTQYLKDVCSLAHELHHLKIDEIFKPMEQKLPLAFKIYAGLTNEACTYAFEDYVFGKELKQKYPEFKQELSEFPKIQSDYIDGWMRGRVVGKNDGIPKAAKYIDIYLKNKMSRNLYPPVDKQDFMNKMAPFQQRETGIPLESFPWYKPSKSGGYYIIGREVIMEVDKRGAPVFHCIHMGKRKFKSIVYSIEQKKTESGVFVPVNSITAIAERPALPAECTQAQDYMDGKISKEDLKADEELKLPKTVHNMTNIVAWRESFVPEKPLSTPSQKKGIRKTNTHE